MCLHMLHYDVSCRCMHITVNHSDYLKQLLFADSKVAAAAHLYAPLVLPPLPADARGLKMPTMATRSPGLQESTRSDSSTISTAAAATAAQAAVRHARLSGLLGRTLCRKPQRLSAAAAPAAAAKDCMGRCYSLVKHGQTYGHLHTISDIASQT
jgi:hypothetical protein